MGKQRCKVKEKEEGEEEGKGRWAEMEMHHNAHERAGATVRTQTRCAFFSVASLSGDSQPALVAEPGNSLPAARSTAPPASL